jgi:hypothetical protein
MAEPKQPLNPPLSPFAKGGKYKDLRFSVPLFEKEGLGEIFGSNDAPMIQRILATPH